MTLDTMKKRSEWIGTLIALHILLAIFSLGGVCSKLAGKAGFLSFTFCLFYGCLLAIMGVYAIGWQQIIKRMSLTAAYANKAITVVWGIVWGFVIFNEHITVGKIAGASLIIAGIILYSLAESKEGGADD